MNTIPDQRSFLVASRGKSRSTVDAVLARDPRPLLIVLAAPGRVPVVSGVRVVAVTSLQDCLVGLVGVPETTPWAEWGAPLRGAGILRRQLKARRGRKVPLARDGEGALMIATRRAVQRPDQQTGSKKLEVRS